MTRYYKLDDDLNPVPAASGFSAIEGLDDYAMWHDRMPDAGDWYVAKTGIGFQIAVDRVLSTLRVSTVFLGLDHNWHGGPPILWETMVFDDAGPQPDTDMHQCRYDSHAKAVEGHKRICRLIASEGLAAMTNRSKE